MAMEYFSVLVDVIARQAETTHPNRIIAALDAKIGLDGSWKFTIPISPIQSVLLGNNELA
jgi:hypothetical protein